LRYSWHAQQRLAERAISEEEVDLVVSDAEVSYPDLKGNRCYVREVAGRTIRVVIDKDDPEHVITVIKLG
jgi:hypothetical protein